MIKAVESLPKQVRIRKKTMMELITDDLREAIKNKIHAFEFCGKNYNLKYLQGYCSQPISQIYMESLEQTFLKYIIGKPFPKNINFFNLLCMVTREEKDCSKKYIHIKHVTDEHGKDHVYGKIDPKALKEAWERYYKPIADAYIGYEIEKQRKLEARKAG